MTAHQIENIAVGADRTYAFNLLYYAENGFNYGLTGKDHTPLRSLAAYAIVAPLKSRYVRVGTR